MNRMDHVRTEMSEWRFWMAIAYFAIVAILVWQVSLSSRQAREQAARVATARSAAQAQVSGCYTAVKNAPVVAGFIRAQDAIIDNGLIANRASIVATPGDPLNPVRRKAIVRLEGAKKNADQLRRLIEKTTPTVKSCDALASKLGVKPPHSNK